MLRSHAARRRPCAGHPRELSRGRRRTVGRAAARQPPAPREGTAAPGASPWAEEPHPLAPQITGVELAASAGPVVSARAIPSSTSRFIGDSITVTADPFHPHVEPRRPGTRSCAMSSVCALQESGRTSAGGSDPSTCGIVLLGGRGAAHRKTADGSGAATGVVLERRVSGPLMGVARRARFRHGRSAAADPSCRF